MGTIVDFERLYLDAKRKIADLEASEARLKTMVANAVVTIANQEAELDALRQQQGEPPAEFVEWLCREIPPGTVISDPKWWAPRIYRAMHAAAPDGPDCFDGHDCEGFQGGCERMGCEAAPEPQQTKNLNEGGNQ